MMNNGNMQGMGVQRGGMMTPQQLQLQQQQQQLNGIQRNGGGQNGVPSQIQKYIFDRFRTQQLPMGWQQTMNPNLRMHLILQLITQLRLMRQQITATDAADIALRFELNKLTESPNQQAYEALLKAKQNEITATRSRQAQSMQQQFQNSQGMMNMPQQMGMPNGMPNGMPATRPGQFPPGFPNQQPPRQMHPSGMQMQQQGPQPGLMGPTMPLNHMQQAQATQQGSQQSVPGTGNFTQEENQLINQMARQLAQRASPQEIEAIRAKIGAMPPAKRQQLEAQKIDPLHFWFRQQAAVQFAQTKRMREGIQHPGQQQVMPPGPNPQRGAAAPNMVNRNSQQGLMSAGPQNFNGPYGDSQQMNHILDMQRKGFESQVDGRTVVPANPQPLGQQPVQRGLQGQQQFPQGQTPRPMPNTQTPRPQQNGLTGQNGGLSGTMAQALPQRSPAMQTLNQPMSSAMQRPPSQNAAQPSQQPPNPTPTPSRNLQGTPQLPQHFQNDGNNNQSHLTQQRLTQMNIPPAIQQKLLSLPPDQQPRAWKVLMESRRQQQQSLNRNAVMAGTPGQPQQMSQSQIMQNQQFPQQRPVGQVSNMQGTSGGQAVVPGNQNKPPGNFMQPQTMVPGSQQVTQQHLQRPVPKPPIAMTEEQIRHMDRQDYPTTILSSSILMQHMPQDVKTWGDLKSWVSKNPHLMPAEILEKLKGLQGLHFNSLVTKHQQMRKQQLQDSVSSQPGQPIGRPVPPQPVAPVAPMGSQISAQELLVWRSKFPRLGPMPDDQLRQIIMMRRAEGNNQSIARQQHDQSEAQTNAQRPTSTPFSPPQPQPTSAKPGLQANQTGKPGTQQGPNQQSRNTNQGLTQVATSAKGAKRPNSDDVGEASNLVSDQARGPRTAGGTVAVPQKSHQGSDASKASQMAQVVQAPQSNHQSSNTSQITRFTGDINVRRNRYKQLKEQIEKSFQSSDPVQMDAPIKERIAFLLLNHTAMVQRTDMGICRYFTDVDNNEDTLRDLLHTRLAIVEQYGDDKFTTCVDNFTISLSDCETGIQKLTMILSRVREFAMRHQQPSQTAGSSTTAITALSNARPMSNQPEDNTSRQPVRPLPIQRSHSNRDKDVPTAPTTDKPPFSFGVGVPMYHGSNDLTQEKLNLPDHKRRKLNTGPTVNASKPQPGAATPGQGMKATSPQIPKVEVVFRCPAHNCEFSKKGFATADALARHAEEVHREKDPEDPLAYMLDQAKLVTGLDSQGKVITKSKASGMEKSVSSQPMNHSLSVQSGTPMSRLSTSQPGSVGGMRTPQGTPSTKLGSLDEKSTPQRTSQTRLEVIQQSSKEPLTPPDLWGDVGISPAELSNSFPSLSEIQGCPSLSSLTPESTSSSNKSEKNSPKASDIGENDGLEINMDFEMPPSISREVWDTQYDSFFVNDDIFTSDWETAFQSDPVIAGNKGGKRNRLSADDNFPFDASLFSFEL